MSGKLSQQNFVNVGTTSTFFLTANPKRRGLIVSSPPTNRVTLAFGAPAVDGQGITVEPATIPVRILVDDFGEVVQRDIFAVSAVGAQNVSFTEIMDY